MCNKTLVKLKCIVGCIQGNVRLQDGSSTSGRVEICLDNQWGDVCNDSSWSALDARVVCIELGLPSSSKS